MPLSWRIRQYAKPFKPSYRTPVLLCPLEQPKYPEQASNRRSVMQFISTLTALLSLAAFSAALDNGQACAKKNQQVVRAIGVRL